MEKNNCLILVGDISIEYSSLALYEYPFSNNNDPDSRPLTRFYPGGNVLSCKYSNVDFESFEELLRAFLAEADLLGSKDGLYDGINKNSDEEYYILSYLSCGAEAHSVMNNAVNFIEVHPRGDFQLIW
eukprot:CAMPEP_0113313388 /NCGR_PEP_ID=MMETSP0010_2-20120614/9833_1 /TAXON_ID=216773 ORGANISM="Corethron hystrix, Strain 308" /NCGR_SAMPLE_ID=MMETSP0010_2 /ASSEMBLY_ACC=CAM_ASM_000155 /LENGTH=127 /DNA_ID=CAMNT_0000169393 /DNA_START=211 /DNA_END=591 /DNA_ORIENTATION=- /assembly_acc=CAM_ASM_000155